MRLTSEEVTASVDGFEPMADVEILAPGTRLTERYEVRRVLGAGGHAVVYLAYDRELKANVALKVLRRERTSQAGMVRLKRELTVARAAVSPHLVRVFDIHSAADALYLSMEYVEGESLRERLDRGPLEIEEAIRIVAGILAGLAALHEHGVVHRDVKPANVLITTAGVVKLADFGLARRFDGTDERATETGAFIGTVDYVAPEQAMALPVDHRADLYACGIVLFEMLTGERPFSGDSWFGSIVARVHRRPPDVGARRSGCPRWVAELVRRLIAREPAARYASASSALDAIERRRAGVRVPWRFASAFAITAAAIVAATSTRTPTSPPSPRFSQLVHRGNAIAAIDSRGVTLWHHDRVNTEVAMRSAPVRMPDGRVLLAMYLHAPDEVSHAQSRVLSLVDPDSGRIVDRRVMPTLAEGTFQHPDHYVARAVAATDIDHDGFQEVVTSFTHMPESPSYTVIYDTRSDVARIAFHATGHHWLVGAADLDHDREDELLVAGINNGYGWYNALGAVRAAPLLRARSPYGPPNPPDMAASRDYLLWYTILPRGEMDALPAKIAPRRITVRFADGKSAVVGFDGFATGLSGAPDRSALRTEVFNDMRVSRRLITTSADEAIAIARRAVQTAGRVGEPLLEEVARLQMARVLALAGRNEEADRLYRQIAETSTYSEEVGRTAAMGFHLAGDLARAEAWYRRTLNASLKAEDEISSAAMYAVEGLVWLAAESGDWNAALKALDLFERTRDRRTEMRNVRNFVYWRSGALGAIEDEPFHILMRDVTRYWSLEFALARGEDPARLLSRLDPDLTHHSYARSMALSLKAELLSRLGRHAEARDTARRALEHANVDRATSLPVRAHFDLVNERAVRYVGPRS